MLSDRSVLCPVLVGRTADLASLDQLAKQARSGHGQIALIAGEAGIGKSRLVAEAKAQFGSEMLILEGHCFEHDSVVPYAPLLDLLRTYFSAHLPSDQLLRALGSSASELTKLLPELAAPATNLPLAQNADPELEKRRLFEALRQLFFRLSETQRLFIVVEDLHWSDDTSLELLLYLARRFRSQPILLVLTYRSDQVDPRLGHLLAEMDRERLATEFALKPLSLEEVDRMIGAIFGLARSVRREFLEPIYALTEGNPFFIEEVLKAVVAAGPVPDMDGPWDRKAFEKLHIPRSVQDAVRIRTEQLGQAEQGVLTLAAVAGQRFGFTLVQELTEMNEQELVQIIKQLIAAQLVVEESADQYAFRHALTREAVYAALLRKERKTLHQRVADTLERIHASTPDQQAGDLAYHFFNAGVWEKALGYSRRAGERAQALYAPHEAIEHLTRALKAAHQLSLPPPVEVLRARGKAFETAGEFEAARGDYEQALNAAQMAQQGAAEWQALIDLGLMWASRDYTKAHEYFQRALELARKLGEPAKLGHSLNRLGNWHVNVEQPQEALRFHQEALAIFRGLEDKSGLAQTLDLLGMANYLGGDLIQSAAFYNRAIALFRELDDRQGLASSLATLALCGGTHQTDTMVPAAGPGESVEIGEMALKLAGEIGWRTGQTYAQFTLAFCLGAQGEYAHALQLAHTGLEIAQEIEHRQWTTAVHCVLGSLYLDLLAPAAARQHLETALALAQKIGSMQWILNAAGLLASTWILQHELARAESVLGAAPESETAARTLGQRLVWCARVELALARRDPNLALQIVERMLTSAANLSEHVVIPRLWKLRGEALAALGQAHEAEMVWLAAKKTALAQGARPLLWRIHVALGRMYQSRGRREEAAEEFSAAREVIEALADNVPDQDLRRNFLERALALMPRGRAPTPARAEKGKFGGLTLRERQVAALIAQGKSNREIADQLVVGLRTVEAHITHILDKRGFSSRAQIAVWAVENGLVQAPADKQN